MYHCKNEYSKISKSYEMFRQILYLTDTATLYGTLFSRWDLNLGTGPLQRAVHCRTTYIIRRPGRNPSWWVPNMGWKATCLDASVLFKPPYSSNIGLCSMISISFHVLNAAATIYTFWIDPLFNIHTTNSSTEFITAHVHLADNRNNVSLYLYLFASRFSLSSSHRGL